jgi:hypothetical protein
LTQDDVQPEDVRKGKKFHHNTGEIKTGTNEFTVDASSATATVDTVLEGATFGKGSEMQVGKMPNKSGVDVIIDSKDGTTIERGCYSGLTKAKLSDAELAKLVPGNIKKGANILGVEGDYGPDDMTAKEKVVTPSFQEQVFVPADDGADFYSSVKVAPIKITETENEFGGITVTIG